MSIGPSPDDLVGDVGTVGCSRVSVSRGSPPRILRRRRAHPQTGRNHGGRLHSPRLAAEVPHHRGEARPRRARPRREDRRAGAAGRGLRGDLHRACTRPPSRSRRPRSRRTPTPSGSRAIPGAHMTLFPKVREAAPRARAPTTSSSSAAGSSRPTTSPKLEDDGHREGLHARRHHRRRSPTWLSERLSARTRNERLTRGPLRAQGKELFRAQGIPTPAGRRAPAPRGGRRARRGQLGGRSVVKVQVQVGGRGKGGGVVLVDSPERAAEESRAAARAPASTATWSTGCSCEELLPIAQRVLHLDPARPLAPATTWR